MFVQVVILKCFLKGQSTAHTFFLCSYMKKQMTSGMK